MVVFGVGRHAELKKNREYNKKKCQNEFFPLINLKIGSVFKTDANTQQKKTSNKKSVRKKIAAQSQTANTYTKNLYRLYVRSRARETKETQEKIKTRKGYRLRLL